MAKESNKKYKLNYAQTFLIGFGFLASSLAWSIYNSQVPLILDQRFALSTTVIGIIMTIDNFFGIIFQPLVGAWSDNTRTRIGRRMPWIALGMPICAIAFSIIPLQDSLIYFMAAVIIFNLVMSLWRSPVISLMPDVTPRPLRSQANGIINLMGGLGSVLAFLVGGFLSDLRGDKFWAFFFASAIIIISFVVLLVFVREPDALVFRRAKGIPIKNSIATRWAEQSLKDVTQADKEHDEFLLIQFAEEAKKNQDIIDDIQAKEQDEEREPLETTEHDLAEQDLAEKTERELVEAAKSEAEEEKLQGFDALRQLGKAERLSLVFILFAILFWFMGYNAIETFFTLFATNTYDVTDGQATMMLTGFSLTFLVAAIPAGYIGAKLGRIKAIRIGLIGITVLFIPILFRPEQLILQMLLIGGGLFWALVNINSLPTVLEFASNKTIGAFTGYYYFFSFTAAIVSPILFGAIRDLSDSYNSLFIYAVTFFVLAMICMWNVHHGDAVVMNETETEEIE